MIPLLKIDYFYPVVQDWTPECQAREIEERAFATFELFVITPKMTGVFSIAEVTESAVKFPEKTILCVLDEDDGETFAEFQGKSLKAVEKLVSRNGAKVFPNLKEVAEYLNK